MIDVDAEIEDAREKVRLARVAYQEAHDGSDAARTKELRTQLDDAEAALARLRMRGSGPPSRSDETSQSYVARLRHSTIPTLSGIISNLRASANAAASSNPPGTRS